MTLKDYTSGFVIIVVCLLGVTLLPRTVEGYLNIFINQREMIKLMGLDAELFYVRNGIVNTYALIFVVPVPADVFYLEFSWQSLTEFPLRYSIIIEYESQLGGLRDPLISISDKGYIPRALGTFTIQLPCTGNVSEEVPLGINIYIEGHPNFNDTHLTFKRNKICLKSLSPNAPASAIANSQSRAVLGVVACALGMSFVVGLIASVVFMRARKHQASLNTSYATTSIYGSHQNVVGHIEASERRSSVNSGSYATIASFNKLSLTETGSKKPLKFAEWFQSNLSIPSPYATTNLVHVTLNHRQVMVQETSYTKPELPSPSHISYYAYSQLNQYFDGTNRPLLCKDTTQSNTNRDKSTEPLSNRKIKHPDSHWTIHTHDNWKQLEVPPSSIVLHKLIREGTYGRVYQGVILSHTNHNSKTKVRLNANDHSTTYNPNIKDLILIKTVDEGASMSQVAFLLLEASKFIGVCHKNLHSPLAITKALPNCSIPTIAYPYCGETNLKLFLGCSRSAKSGSPNTQALVSYGLQLANAVEFIHSLGIIHGDIGTRNCLIDSTSNVVRLGDSALSRDLFPEDYSCLGDNDNRPIKWLALESLQKKLSLFSSDCWSFGVLLWELVTLAEMPYEEVDCIELEAFLRDGFRLEQPVNCPDEFYTVMTCCWLEDHSQRPSFLQLISYLQDFHEDLNIYI